MERQPIFDSYAEMRLKTTDENMFSSEFTKKYRFSHLHLNAFDDDKASRFHSQYFNTNKLK